jgi:hypothetical protein
VRVLTYKNTSKLQYLIADGLDGMYRRCHLDYGDCQLVATVFIAYKLAGKDDKFAGWLQRAVESGDVTPQYLCEGYKAQEVAQCKRLTPEICERLWSAPQKLVQVV